MVNQASGPGSGRANGRPRRLFHLTGHRRRRGTCLTPSRDPSLCSCNFSPRYGLITVFRSGHVLVPVAASRGGARRTGHRARRQPRKGDLARVAHRGWPARPSPRSEAVHTASLLRYAPPAAAPTSEALCNVPRPQVSRRRYKMPRKIRGGHPVHPRSGCADRPRASSGRLRAHEGDQR